MQRYAVDTWNGEAKLAAGDPSWLLRATFDTPTVACWKREQQQRTNVSSHAQTKRGGVL